MANESLYVDGNPGGVGAWNGVGTTPYLSVQDYNTNYIWDDGRNGDSGTFSFANSAVGTGTINSVKLRVYCGNPASNLTIAAVVNDGSTNQSFNFDITTTYQWVEVDISAKLNTWTKIDAATVYWDRPNSSVRTEIDAAYLYIDYTAAAVPYSQTPTETMTLTDTVLKLRTTFRTYTESITENDVLTKIGTFKRAAIESLTLNDTILKSKVFIKSPTEIAALTDTITKVKDLKKSISEVSTLTDTIEHILAFNKILLESSTLTDTITKTKAMVRNIAETATLTDTVTKIKATVKTITESSTLTDTIQHIPVFKRTYNESFALTDSITKINAYVKNTFEYIHISSLYENFEDGTLDKWEVQYISDGDSLTNSTDDPYTGSRGLKTYTDGTTSDSEYSYVGNSVPNSDEYWIRYYIKFKQLPSTDSEFIVIGFITAYIYEVYSMLSISHMLGKLSWRITLRDAESTFSNDYSDETPVIDNWYRVEHHFVQDNTNGYTELYVDGTKICEITGKDTFKSTYLSWIQIGQDNTHIGEACTVYFDDIYYGKGRYGETMSKGVSSIINDTISPVDTKILLSNIIRTSTDSVTLSANMTKIESLQKIRTESLTLTDSIVKSKTFVRDYLESITLLDTIEALSAATQILTETLTLTDVVQHISALMRTYTETLSAIDSIDKFAGAMLIDSLSPTDNSINGISKNINNSITLTDNITKITQITNVEAANLVDSITRINALYRTYTEALSVGNLLLLDSDRIRTITEQISLIDTQTRLRGTYRTYLETLTPNDSALRISNLHKIYTEAITLTDTYESSAAEVMSEILTETLTLLDIETNYVLRTFLEMITLSDILTSSYGGVINQILTEILTLDDMITRQRQMFRIIGEAMTLSELQSKAYSRTLNEIKRRRRGE